MGGLGGLLLAALVAIVLMAAVSTYIYYGRLYMRSRVAGAEVGFRRMFRMTLSGVSAFRVVTAYLNAKQAGLDIPLNRFEEHARAGGDPRQLARRPEPVRRAGDDRAAGNVADAR